MPTLLFVCTGNLCRSPMAAALARNVLAGRAEAVDVISAVEDQDHRKVRQRVRAFIQAAKGVPSPPLGG